MSLSAAERLAVYECLRITAGPGGGSAVNSSTVHNGFGVVLTLTQMDQLRSEVDAFINGLATDQETAVKALVVEWNRIRLNTASVDSGAVGSTSGITYSAIEKRERIRELLMTYIPVYSIAASMKQRNDGADSCFIGISR